MFGSYPPGLSPGSLVFAAPCSKILFEVLTCADMHLRVVGCWGAKCLQEESMASPKSLLFFCFPRHVPDQSMQTMVGYGNAR